MPYSLADQRNVALTNLELDVFLERHIVSRIERIAAAQALVVRLRASAFRGPVSRATPKHREGITVLEERLKRSLTASSRARRIERKRAQDILVHRYGKNEHAFGTGPDESPCGFRGGTAACYNVVDDDDVLARKIKSAFEGSPHIFIAPLIAAGFLLWTVLANASKSSRIHSLN